MARAGGKPFRSCGRKKLSNLSLTLQQTWAASENEKCYKLDFGNLAYFRFCKNCHKQHWPSDMRQQGSSCKPAAPVWAKWRDVADGVCKLFSGDFFLTRAPPDFSLTWILPCLWSGLSQGAAAFVNTFPVGTLCLYGGVWMYCLYPQM